MKKMCESQKKTEWNVNILKEKQSTLKLEFYIQQNVLQLWWQNKMFQASKNKQTKKKLR